MAQANSEDGLLADELANLLRLILERLGIAGPIREKNSVRIHCEDIISRSQRGNDCHSGAAVDQPPQNIAFDSEVVRYYVTPRLSGRVHRFRRRTPLHRLVP